MLSKFCNCCEILVFVYSKNPAFYSLNIVDRFVLNSIYSQYAISNIYFVDYIHATNAQYS